MTSTGKLLKFYRELRNNTPEVLAESINIDYRTYLRIENGKRELKVSEMIKLSEILEISPEMLYSNPNLDDNIKHLNNTDNHRYSGDNRNSDLKQLLRSIYDVLKAILIKLK